MKKIILTLLCCVALVQSNFANNIDLLINKASKMKHVEKVEINSTLLSMTKLTGITKEIPALSSLSKVEIYNLEHCLEKDKFRFTKDISKRKKDKSYDVLMEIIEKTDNVVVLTKRQKDIIKELVILVHGSSVPAIIKLSGDITSSDIASLISKYSKMR